MTVKLLQWRRHKVLPMLRVGEKIVWRVAGKENPDHTPQMINGRPLIAWLGLFRTIFLTPSIDSLDGLTFRNQLISILLVMPTGQHLHAKMLKLDYAFFESMAENR